jgi:hypothetical protein
LTVIAERIAGLILVGAAGALNRTAAAVRQISAGHHRRAVARLAIAALTGGRIADRSATAGSARTRIAASIEQHAALFARFGASVVDGAATVRVWIAELVGLARSAAQDTAASIVDRTAARAALQTSLRHTGRIAAARASAAISGSAARAALRDRLGGDVA